MVGDEGETDTHRMRCAVVIVKTLRPDLFSSGENELTFSGLEDKAETIK